MTNKPEPIDEHRCNCNSYNTQEGKTPNVILAVPENIRCYTDDRETICVDACIAAAIEGLWHLGLPTLNSCCGHNKERPTVIIPQDVDPQVYLRALAQIDAREWIVSRWERVEYSRASQPLTDSGRAGPVYQYREIGSGIWEECGKDWFDHCSQSPEHDTRTLYAAMPAPVVPDTLPCPVHLEPGLKFGKGVRTQCMLDALRRRADYYAELEAMTPEQRAEHDAGIAEFKTMLGNASRAAMLASAPALNKGEH